MTKLPSHQLSTIYSRVWKVAHELPDTDETVLFDETGSELLVLSDTGAAVWYLLDGQRSVGDILGFIRTELPSTPETAGTAVLEFIDTLVARGAVSRLES